MPTQADLTATWLKARRERALRYLAARDHSQAELTKKLTQLTRKEQQQADQQPSAASREELVAGLIDELLANNYLCDERFLHSLTNKLLRQGKGPIAFKQAFQEHKLAADLVAEQLDKLEEIWPEQLARVATKKFGEELPSEQKAKAKAFRFLASRGFTPNQIFSLFN